MLITNTCPQCNGTRVLVNISGDGYLCNACGYEWHKQPAPVSLPSADGDAKQLTEIRTALENHGYYIITSDGTADFRGDIQYLLSLVDRLTAELAKRDEWVRVAKGWIPGDDDETDYKDADFSKWVDEQKRTEQAAAGAETTHIELGRDDDAPRRDAMRETYKQADAEDRGEPTPKASEAQRRMYEDYRRLHDQLPTQPQPEQPATARKLSEAKLTAAQRRYLEFIAHYDKSTSESWLEPTHGRRSSFKVLLDLGLIEKRQHGNGPVWKQLVCTTKGYETLGLLDSQGLWIGPENSKEWDAWIKQGSVAALAMGRERKDGTQ